MVVKKKAECVSEVTEDTTDDPEEDCSEETQPSDDEPDIEEVFEVPEIEEGEKVTIEVAQPTITQLEEDQIELSSVDDALEIKIPSMNIIAGMTSSGKTNLVRHICLRYASKVHRIIVLCPTIDLHDSYSFVDAKNVILEPTEEHVINIMKEQKKYKGRLSTLLIMDDCVGLLKFNANTFAALAGTGRHFNLTTLVLMQDLKKLPPIMRTNSRSIFVTKLSSHSLTECFDLSNGFKNYREFQTYMEKACRDFRIVRLNLTGDAKQSYLCFQPGVCEDFITKKPTKKKEEKIKEEKK